MGSGRETVIDDVPRGRPLAIDATAQSASPTEPAFIARPEGAPVYYGFVVLAKVTVDGFFVIAPDGGRAGLVWEVYDPPYFREIMPVEAGRGGVWGVGFGLPINSRENARRNLESILPEFKLRWAKWKSRFTP